MSITIKFGTDGWREIIGDTFISENVMRVASATAEYLLKQKNAPVCVVGYDCRFGGKMFAQQTACVLADRGIRVILSDGFVSTPMVSLANVKLNADMGVIITASHNPPEYNGYKLKAAYGGPSTPAVIAEVENLIPGKAPVLSGTFERHLENGMIRHENLEDIYIEHVKSCFDLDMIRKSGLKMAYDAMYGAGQNVIRRLFPEAELLHCDNNPGFHGRAPEPILKNLPELSKMLAESGKYSSGLATDGDADRIGFFDEKGRFIDSHHLILLLIQYLTQFKGFSGKVVKSFSVSDRVGKLAAKKGLETITTKIGFKYICEYMVTDDVLIGAEESGGIAIKGHIPERDGIWMGLVMWEYMARTGKSMTQLIDEVYAEVGQFYVERYDLHITEDLKQSIIGKCRSGEFTAFGNYTVQKTEDIDGYKFQLGNDEWVMIRPSGTEPVLRVYAESSDRDSAIRILDTVKNAIGA